MIHKQERTSTFDRVARCVGLLGVAGVLLLSACDRQKPSKDLETEDDTAKANATKSAKPVADAEVAVMEAEDPAYGQIVIELYSNVAPKMVERFKKLIVEGFYDGTAIHRIDPALGIIQGGDPLSKDNDPANDGTGSSPYPNVPAEFSEIMYERGVVGAARQGAGPGVSEKQASDTANCQFYITLKRQPAFDQKYTVFGRVISGINDADIIAHAPVAPGTERPLSRIVIKKVTLQARSNFAK